MIKKLHISALKQLHSTDETSKESFRATS